MKRTLICTLAVGLLFGTECTVFADESVAGTYTFEESAMGGQFTVPWTLELREDDTYTLTEDNAFMGQQVYEGTYTCEDGVITTGPFENDPPQAAFFESDKSCKWTLDGDTCTPVNYNEDSSAPENGQGDDGKPDGDLPGGSLLGGGLPDGSLPEGGLPAGDGMMKMNGAAAESNADATAAYASNSESQICDIYLPEGDGTHPVIVLVHGGGFMFGDQRMEIIQPVIQAGVENGYAVVSVDYRKSGEAAFPAALSDVKAAVRFVRANAEEYGFDTDNITIWGESAGAYLALMTALTPDAEELNGDVEENREESSSVKALVDFYGPVEFYTMDEEYAALGTEDTTYSEDSSFESKFLGQAIGEDEETTYQTYWETYKDKLPEDFTLKAWIQAGNADASVPYTQSENFAERLGEVLGAENVNFGILEGAGHEDAAFYTEENLAAIFEFLKTAE